MQQELTTLQIQNFAKTAQQYRGADTYAALWQLGSTLGLFIGAMALMFAVVDIHYTFVLVIAPFAAGLMVRLFIIQHDCGHGSFLPTQWWNDVVGRIVSPITMTPYSGWKREHAHHHAGSGNLDRRGVGEIKLLTVREYRALSTLGKLGYRSYRNIFFLILIGGPLYFLVLNRLPWFRSLPASDVWRSVVGLDIALVLVLGGIAAGVGFQSMLLVVIPTTYMAAVIGVWLFYVQHQFEETAWYSQENWTFQEAAVKGSSYYALPPILAWFTGNIGIHHVHHLVSTIPNYKLQKCLKALPEMQHVNRLTFWESLVQCTKLRLWDEDKHMLVGIPP